MGGLPWLKEKNQFSDGFRVEKRVDKNGMASMLDQVTEEAFDSITKKDFKAFRHALEALVLYIRDKDREQDG